MSDKVTEYQSPNPNRDAVLEEVAVFLDRAAAEVLRHGRLPEAQITAGIANAVRTLKTN